MRSHLLLATLLLARLSDPAAAQDYHFTKDIGPGGRVELENINGAIEVVRATGRTAGVTVTKTVTKGDGNMVKAIMESGNGMHVCTIYVNRDPKRSRCNGDNNNSTKGHDNFDVEMRYVVKVPAGGRRRRIETVNEGTTIRKR